MGYQLSLVSKVGAIHLAAEVPLPRLSGQHRGWLRRIQQHVRIRPLPLREVRETNGNLWNTRRTFGEQTIRGEPRGGGTLLGILAEPDINGIVVFGDVAVDVVQAAVPHLNVNLALEECGEELDERGYDASTSPTSKSSQYTVADHPRGDVPMWGATALVLRLHHPLKHDKEFVSVSSGEEEPHTAYQEVHVQSHEVSTSPYALQVRLYEIRKMELPLRGRDGDEQVG